MFNLQFCKLIQYDLYQCKKTWDVTEYFQESLHIEKNRGIDKEDSYLYVAKVQTNNTVH